MIIWILVSVILALADQLTKYWVISSIPYNNTKEVLPGLFNFVYVKNTGAAFSILSGRTSVLGIVSMVVCVFVIWYLVKKKPKSALLLTSLGMILGGALGNLADRILRGYVVDFIELDFISFPVFNVADIAITVGAALLMIYVIFFDDKKKTKEAED